MTPRRVVAAPDTVYCGALKRQGPGTCTRPAGWGTQHVGQGRCKLHGGNNLIRHGRYSGLKRAEIRDAIERHEKDPDPLNILPELAAARALFENYIERYEEWRDAFLAWHASYLTENENPKPRQVLDIADAYRIVSEITKIVERIEKIRAADAISRPDLYRLVQEFARVVETHNSITDPAKRLEKIRNDWLSIRLA